MRNLPLSGRRLLQASCAVLLVLPLASSAATLTNRYSFTTDVSDSVGGKNGTLVNGTIVGGQAVLNNGIKTSGDASGQYISLPANLLTNYNSVTLEAWLTPTLDDSTGGAFWARVWDFGSSDGNVGVNSFMYARIGNSTAAVLADSFTAANGDNWCYTSAEMLNGLENHFVWTADATTHRARVYLNGVQVGQMDTFTNSPVVVGTTTNDWLGRSQFAGDPYANASFNEFRVYSGALNPLEVAANFQAGPDTYPAAFGSVTNISLILNPTVPQGAATTAQVLADASGLTNSINISDSDLVVSFASGNTNVAKVDSAGVVSGVGVGTTTIIATYGSISTTGSIQVISLPTTLIHRYSFTSDASDSVGTANGTLYGNATISGGQVLLDGAQGSYVDLGSYLIAPSNIPNNSITLEGWATFYPTNGAWTRFFDFGNINGGLGANYIFFAPNNGANGGQARLAVSDVSPGYTSESGFNINNVLGRTNLHVVAVYNPNPSAQILQLYLNGTLVGSTTTTKQLSGINNVFSFLGRSTYSGDSWLAGSIDEFRIYNGALDRFQIAASDQAGPNQTNFNVGTFQSFVFTTGVTNLYLDAVHQVSACILNFSQATNINILTDPNLTFTASDPTVVSVSNAGLIHATRVGSATITATYHYVVAGVTNTYTATSPLITVLVPPAQLVHRYNFNEGAGSVVHDIVGGADAAIMIATNTLGVTNAVWDASGQLIINTNTTLGAQDTFINLPAGIASALVSNATFEAWVTDYASAGWQRIFDFGGRPGSPTNGPDPNVFLTRGPGNTNPRYDWVTGNITSSAVWTNLGQGHFVVLHDGTDNSAKLYMNGVLVASSGTLNEALSSLSDTNCFLGRSIYSWPLSLPGGYFDPYYQGSFNEFRIYKGLLTEAEIQQDYALGPDQLIGKVPLAVKTTTSQVVLSWPRYAPRYTLFSSPVLGAGAAWTATTGTVTDTGTNFLVTVPVTGSARFFRLQQ